MVKIDFNKKGIKLYNANCFDVFKNIKKESIDLFILDLPYGQTACKWDTCIDLEQMWIDVKRIMKPDAILCFFCTTKFGYQLIKSNEKWFKYDLIWQKSRKVGFLSANRRQLRNHENIYIFRDSQGTYNAQKIKGKPYKMKERNNAGYYYADGKYKRTPLDNKGDRYPASVIEHESIVENKGGAYNNGKPFKRMPPSEDGKRHPTSVIENTILKYNNPHKTIHRTEKPVGLLEYLIKTYSNEGETVMDFTMGSGSCGVACYNTKRKFIGIEMDNDIYQLTKNRIKDHIKK